MAKKLTTKDFIEKSQETHGDKYNYSISNLQGMKNKITIICPTHGEFDQIALNHARGSGCPKCANENKQISLTHFIEKASNTHNSKYDYSLTKLISMNKKVTIICPIHGKFEQRAASHVEGSGCPQCYGNQPKTIERFVVEAQAKHNKYTYDNVSYVNSNTKIIITCPIHGDFEQTPKDHLHGYGCPACGGTKPIIKEEFINRAQEVHGTKYKYDKLVMNGMNGKGIITCSIHGDFEQRLADHASGNGCPKCGHLSQGGYCEEYFDNNPHMKKVPANLYFVEFANMDICKVGITTQKYIQRRFPGANIVVHKQVELELYEAFIQEQVLLSVFKNSRYEIGSFHYSGWTECFPIEMKDQILKEMEQL